MPTVSVSHVLNAPLMSIRDEPIYHWGGESGKIEKKKGSGADQKKKKEVPQPLRKKTKYPIAEGKKQVLCCLGKKSKLKISARHPLLPKKKKASTLLPRKKKQVPRCRGKKKEASASLQRKKSKWKIHARHPPTMINGSSLTFLHLCI